MFVNGGVTVEVTLRGHLTAGLKHEHENLSSPSLVFLLTAAPWDQWNSHGFLSVLVTLPQLVDVQINVKTPLSFKKSCRRLFFWQVFSPLSLALLTPTVRVVQVVKDPARGRTELRRIPGSKASRLEAEWDVNPTEQEKNVCLSDCLLEEDGWGGNSTLLQQPLKAKLFTLFWQANLPCEHLNQQRCIKFWQSEAWIST